MLLSDFGIVMPDFDFSVVEKFGYARLAASGDIGGVRCEIVGDKEAVFVSVSGLSLAIAKQEGNLAAVANMLTDTLGMDTSEVTNVMNTVGTVVTTVNSVVGTSAA